MEKLSMCRICLADDTRLQSIFGTHLQEMFEFLTMMLLVTEDSRPSLACDLCCSRLETCYELRRQCLRSEELFTQLLRHKVQVKLQVMPNMDLSMEDVMETTADILVNNDVKQEDAEGDARDDSGASSEDDTAKCDVMKKEPTVGAWGPSFEEDPFEEEDHLQSSDSEDVISLAVVKEEQSDVTANDAAVEQDDADPYHSALGLHTECDIPLDIVKEEPDDVDTGAPRLAAQNHRNDMLLNSHKRTDQTMNKVEERIRETRRAVEDTPVEKNKIMETGDDIDIRYSISNHSDAHKKMFKNKISAELSVISSSSDKLTPLLCDTCQKSFTRKANLIRHIRAHTGEKSYRYSISNHSDAHKKMFENKISAELSVISSSSDKLTPLLCDTCQKSFTRKANLIRHIRAHTGEKSYQCNICRKCFSNNYNLSIHIRTHTGEKPYECNVCKKCFTHKCQLDIHNMCMHTDEKPNQCKVCKKCFTKKWYLDRHFRVHTGEKPYKCDVCAKRFNGKGELIRHFRSHTGEKPYECNVCKKCFRYKSGFNYHIRTHAADELYECTVCKECFTRKCHLNTHMRTHKGEKPYECNVCKKCFIGKSHLNRHMRAHIG